MFSALTHSSTPNADYTFQHYSPLIGRLAKTKGTTEDGATEKYDFEANQIQLAGPVSVD